MTRRWQQLALWGVLVVALLGVGAATFWRGMDARLLGRGRAGAGGTATGSVAGGAGTVPELADYGRVPAFELVSQMGRKVTLADLRGQVWVGDFFFTGCGSSCPMMTAQLQGLESALGDTRNVRLVSFSVDPERDTPERLAEYARGYGASPERWLFLTGDKAQVRRLAVEGFHVTVDDASPEDVAKGSEAVLHSTRLALVDARGTIRGYYDGTDAKAVQQLGGDVRRLLQGATR